MPLTHAVVLIDHHAAQVLQFDSEKVRGQEVKSHVHYTRQHHSGVRTEHEFFKEVCDALEGISEVLVTGPKTALADFHHYVEKHRSPMASHVLGWEAQDHPTEGQLLAFARKFFLELDARLAGMGRG